MDHLDNLDHLGHLYHLYHLDHLDTSLPIWDVVQDYHSTDPDHSDYTALPPGNMSHVSHTPPGCFLSKLGCSTNQEGASANTERRTYVFGKLSATRFQHRPCWHRHYSNSGDIDHGNIGPGGASVICTAVYSRQIQDTGNTHITRLPKRQHELHTIVQIELYELP